MANYIVYPITTNPAALLQRIYDYLEANVPGWTPAEGNLDVWLSEAFASETAELTDVASGVPDSIVAYLGRSVFNVPPILSASAVVGTTWTMVDAAGYTIPAGTQVGLRDSDGNIVPFITVNTVVVPAGSLVTGAGAIAIQAVTPGASANGLGGVVQPIDILSFVNTIATVGVSAGGQDAETPGDYLSRLVGDLQLLSPTPILPGDFAALALQAGTAAYRSTAVDGYNPTHNLLSANDASLETSVGNWINNANATVTRDATFGVDGISSLKEVSVAAGNYSASLANAAQVAVTPGDQITVVGTVKPALARTCAIYIGWYTATHTFIGSVATTAAVGAGATATLSKTATAPATAAFAGIFAETQAAVAAGEVTNWDKLSIRRGTTTDWVAGGTAETNNPRTVSVYNLDINGANISAGDKTTIQNYLNSLRETGWLTYVLDPTSNQIDVTVTVAMTPGSVSATVIAAVTAAIQAYLNPATWGQSSTSDGSSDPHSWTNTPKIYRYKLAQIIEEVDGVDHIVGNLLTGYHGTALAEQDLGIGTPVGVPTSGTITVTTA